MKEDSLSFVKQDEAVPDTDADAIRRFEKDNKIRLPEGYIAFLLQRNGGHPKHHMFRKGTTSAYVEYFLPLTDADRPNLAEYANPDGKFMRIALGGGGDHIYLHLENGKIFKWIHDNPIYEGEDDNAQFERDFVFLADSIKNFIDGLYGG